MSKSARIRVSDLRAILETVSECRDLGDDPVVWREHFLAALAKLVGADGVMGGELTGLRAGRPADIAAIHFGWETASARNRWEQAYRDFAAGRLPDPAIGECFSQVTGERGEASIAQLLGERAWYRSIFYDFY